MVGTRSAASVMERSRSTSVGRVVFSFLLASLSLSLAASPAPASPPDLPQPEMIRAAMNAPARQSEAELREKSDAHEEVRVRLKQASSGVVVSGFDLRYPGSAEKFASRRTRAFEVVKISWKRSAADARPEWTVEDRDSGAVLAKFRSGAFELAGSELRMNLQPVPGRLSLLPVAARSRGLVDVIATLDLETYVRGVLPAEMPSQWPLEALKAQAVAARTFALHRREARQAVHASYHLEANVMDQMYLTPVIDRTGEATASLERVDRAVRETAGLVLTSDRAGARPIAAYFHADCGGRTEDAQAVWGQGGGAGVAVDEGCPLNPAAKWRLTLTSDEIAKRVRAALKISAASQLVDIEPLGNLRSGRIKDLVLSWNDGRKSRMAAHLFRMAVGHERLRSTYFTLERDPMRGQFEFTGKGFGHGVGLCQWGARNLAQQGRSFRLILKHYYPRAMLVDRAAASGERGEIAARTHAQTAAAGGLSKVSSRSN